MSPPRIPDITHLQFLVLGMLRGGDRPGRLLRRALARHGVERTGPAFYQMMARLEDAGLVAGEYEQKVVDGQIIKERRYALTSRGEAAWSSTRVLPQGDRRVRPHLRQGYGAQGPQDADRACVTGWRGGSCQRRCAIACSNRRSPTRCVSGTSAAGGHTGSYRAQAWSCYSPFASSRSSASAARWRVTRATPSMSRRGGSS